MTVIKIKNSSVSGKLPAAGDLQVAELALNTADKKLYSKNASGEVFEVGGGSEVIVQDTPPAVADLEEGTLWWNSASDVLQLYVLFNNGTDVAPDMLWIEASPMPSAADIEGYPDLDPGDTLDGRYVEKNPDGGASQNIAGDLTLGTDKITLDATSGNITGSGEYYTKAEYGGYFIKGSGGDYDSGLYATKRSGDNRRFVAVNAGNGDPAIAFDTTNKDVLFIGDPGNSGSLTNPLATISGAGAATFGGTVIANTFKCYNKNGASRIESNTSGIGLEIKGNNNSDTALRILNSSGEERATISSQGEAAFYNGGFRVNSNNIFVGGSHMTFTGGNKNVRWNDSTGILSYDTTLRGTDAIIELEPDNPDNYTTTMVDGEETQVYSGPTLDVKQKLIAYEERFKQQDAVIAQMTTALRELGKDVASMPTTGDEEPPAEPKTTRKRKS